MKRVLVQAGHLAPREPGFESGTGTAGEIEFAKAVRDKLVRLLRADGRFEPIPVPGDIPNGIRVDAALFLHADGSGNPEASGFSFGYRNYPVNKRLADMIATEFLKLPGHPPHHSDNYTRDLAGYYGFSRVDTAGPEVLVEHGFLTNPGERGWLNHNIENLAEAEYHALLTYFGFGKPKPPHVYHIKLRDEGGKEYEWNNERYPGKHLHEFGLVAHNIVQGWIERK